MPEQRAKGYGNWEDRLPSPFLKVLGFWGESNIAWQKCLCAATLGRREESSGNLMKTGQALYIRPHGELWIIRAADKPQVCNAKLKTTKYGEHRSSTGVDALLVWARRSPGASLHPIPSPAESWASWGSALCLPVGTCGSFIHKRKQNAFFLTFFCSLVECYQC